MSHKRLWKFGVLALAITYAAPAMTASPAGFVEGQLYSVRPPIDDVASVAHPKLPEIWNSLKSAKLEFVAQVLELYPEHEIYFLARDAEYIYDLAHLLSLNDPADLTRMHLLNVSRANMGAAGITRYLAQNGIDAESLKVKKVLFVDTGFAGSIPMSIENRFPRDLRSAMSTHLIVSENPRFPSSRAFLAHLNSNVNRLSPASMHATIVNYEHMHHFTFRADGFYTYPDKKVEAISTTFEKDGGVSHLLAREYMEDLRAFAEDTDTQKQFQELRSTWRDWYALRADAVQLAPKLAAYLNDPKIDDTERLQREARIRDFADVGQTYDWKSVAEAVKPLKLKNVRASSATKSIAAKMTEQFPHWAEHFQDPVAGLATLMDDVSDDWSQIYNFFDAVDNAEWQSILLDSLQKYADDPKKTALLKALNKKPNWHPALVGYYMLSANLDEEPAAKDFFKQVRLMSLKVDALKDDPALTLADGPGSIGEYQSQMWDTIGEGKYATDTGVYRSLLFGEFLKEDHESKLIQSLVEQQIAEFRFNNPKIKNPAERAEFIYLVEHGDNHPAKVLELAMDYILRGRPKSVKLYGTEFYDFIDKLGRYLPRDRRGETLLWLALERFHPDLQERLTESGFTLFPWRLQQTRAAVNGYSAHNPNEFDKTAKGTTEPNIHSLLTEYQGLLEDWEDEFHLGASLFEDDDESVGFVNELKNLALGADENIVAAVDAGINPFALSGNKMAPAIPTFALNNKITTDTGRGIEYARVTRDSDGKTFIQLKPLNDDAKDALAQQVERSKRWRNLELSTVVYEGPYADGSVIRSEISGTTLESMLGDGSFFKTPKQ